MRQAFFHFLKENKRARMFVAISLVLVYVIVYCGLSFSDYLSYSAIAMDDYSHKGANSMSKEIVVVGITEEDLKYFDYCASEIAARTLEKISTKAKPCVLALDVDAATLDESAINIIKGIDLRSTNLILPSIVSFDTLPLIDNLDEAESGITPRSIEKIFGLALQGHTVKLLDENSILRHAVFDITDSNGNTVKSLADLCYKSYCDVNDLEQKERNISSQNTAIIKLSSESKVSYTAKDILADDDVLGDLNGKIVLVGYVYNGIERAYVTSLDYNGYMYPVVFDANVISNLLEGELVVSISLYAQVFFLALAILCVVGVSLWMGFFPAICTCAAYELVIQLGAIMLYRIGYMAYLLPHMINGVLTFVIFTLASFFIQNFRSKEELESLLGRYVDISIVKNLIDTNSDIPKIEEISDAKNVKAAVMFADIRRFTSISESIDATSLFDILNEYLSMMAECIIKYGGTVDKFIGDCAMGYWLVKGAEYNPSYRACLAAKEIQRKGKELSQECMKKYGVNIEVGIGISYGDAVIGNVGSINRANYTIIGDTVNVASRLENLAPEGEIYLSPEVVTSVGESIECESIGKNIRLKNKKDDFEVYKLLRIAPISVKNRTKETENSDADKVRTQALALILGGICGFSVDFLYTLNALRELEISHFLFYPVGLAVLGAALLFYLITRFIQEFNDGVSKSQRFTGSVLFTVISLHIQIALFKLTGTLFADASNPSIPGSGIVYLLNPIVLILFWLLFSSNIVYKHYDVFIGPIVSLVVIALDYYSCKALSLNILYSDIFSITFNLKSILATALLNAVIMALLFELNKLVGFNNFERFSGYPIKEKIINTLNSENKRKFDRKYIEIIKIGINLLIAFLSIRVTYRSYLAGGVDIFSNPSVIGIIVTVMCILSIIYSFEVMFTPEVASHIRWYRYASFMKMLGCIINFLSVMVLALSGGDIKILFEPRWFADWTVFILCPVITFVMWLSERNDNDLLYCGLCSLPFMAILPLSKFALDSAAMLEEYAFEVANFYSTTEIIVIMAGEFISALFLCYVGRVVSKVFTKAATESISVVLSVGGNRRGIVGGEGKSHKFGTHSECYVIRTKDHGIVINAGSGLINAMESLYGCTEVDILLTSCEFSMVMGFLAVKDICPKARIKIHAPFAISSIAAKPYWPANVVKGIYDKVSVGKKIRLNNNYSAQFEYTDQSKKNCMLKITGLANICYTGKLGDTKIDIAKWAQGCGLLIYDAYTNPIEGCYIAIDSNTSYLLLSGFKPDFDDDKFEELEANVHKIISEASLGKEKEEYIVNH